MQDLQRLFVNHKDNNLFLRGSAARGEPFEDVDIHIYNHNGIIPSDLPEEFRGHEVSYRSIPLEDLDEFFRTCLRSASSMIEVKEIYTDQKARDIINKNKKAALNGMAPAYVLFLQIDEEINKRLSQRRTDSTYYTLKRTPGSKRTIFRSLWTLRYLHDELRKESNTYSTIESIRSSKYASDEVCDSMIDVLEMLPDIRKVDISELKQRFRIIDMWVESELTPAAARFTSAKLSSAYFEAVKIARSEKSAESELSDVLSRTKDSCIKPYEKWTILYSISANPSLSEKDMLNISLDYQDHFCYRNIMRNIVRNPSSTPRVLASIDMEKDSYLKGLMLNRKEGKSV